MIIYLQKSIWLLSVRFRTCGQGKLYVCDIRILEINKGYAYCLTLSTYLTIIFRSILPWLVVFYVPSTARSFRDGTPIYCPLQRTWNLVITTGIEPRVVAWQSITLLLRHASSTDIFLIKRNSLWTRLEHLVVNLVLCRLSCRRHYIMWNRQLYFQVYPIYSCS